MAEEKTLEGWTPVLSDTLTLERVIDLAFDYRGNVTVVKKDGSELVGYMFNRSADAPQPFVQMFDEQGTGPINILYAEIQNVKFTGKDTAFGKSWEAWMKKREKIKARRAAGLPVEDEQGQDAE